MSIHTTTSTADDFNFIIGSWRVMHRRLKERLADCDQWIEFEGSSTTTSILGGHGNLEDNFLSLPEGSYRAVALRSFNTITRQWSIWWLDGRYPGVLDTPVVGHFENGEGIFYADDVLNGKPIKVRFKWSVPSNGNPRWEQAFSDDAGETWETNWIMDFSSSSQ